MGKSGKSLRPDNTKVLGPLAVISKLGKGPVENVAQQVAAQAGKDRLGTQVADKAHGVSPWKNSGSRVPMPGKKSYKWSDT